ncbi:unnamed protein product [Ostreobium quekettii]|uniref:Uncharacterized protein n=1 Tax=Ostreobium quekettii TaxID=121088 RepID=A0A8S1J2N4_9CHLO|nr:unnamed protein product [Ostreobium quekettii]|eukprot:evm.model.scf_243.4 EVM.evm.TU.scf_243.4   scf_243:17133-20188(+)
MAPPTSPVAEPPTSPVVVSPASSAAQNGRRRSPFPKDGAANGHGGKQQEVKAVWLPVGRASSNKAAATPPLPAPTPRGSHPPRPGKENAALDLSGVRRDLGAESTKGPKGARIRSESPSYMCPTESSKLRGQKGEPDVKPKKPSPAPKKPRASTSTTSSTTSTTDDQPTLEDKPASPEADDAEETKSSTQVNMETNAYFQVIDPAPVVHEVPTVKTQVAEKHHHRPGLKGLLCWRSSACD